MQLAANWQVWAVLSAVFAAMTAILAKIGVEDVDPDLATFIRTLVIGLLAALIVAASHQWAELDAIPRRSWLFLILSGLATGASWLCYFRALRLGEAARVAPVDKLSVVLVAIFGVVFLGEHLSRANWAGVLLIATGAVLVTYRG